MRLIDADALTDNIAILFERNPSLIDEWLRDHIEDEITEAPTIEAEPVRHGYWDDTRVAFYRKCSECGATVINNLPDVFLDCDIRDLHYCPNCGAKMDEVTE